MSTQEFFSKIPIFKTLSQEDLDVLGRLWVPRKIAANDALFRKGDIGSSMFMIEHGSVEITVPGELGKNDIRVSLLKEGDFFGELSLMTGLARTATATTLQDAHLLEMKRDDFLAFLSSRPAVAISMVGEIGKRLQATNDLLTSLASKNVNQEMEEQLSFGDHLADKVSDFFGSWTFIVMFLCCVGAWMTLNVIELFFTPFDLYPFVFLNLVLAIVASLQAPLIMMSQNRAQLKDRLRAEQDYQVNLKSELMLQQLHAKLDDVRNSEIEVMQKLLERRPMPEKRG
jgi:uncharacterized membrane protein